ncbi:hypothetical protein HZF24_14395 [Sedimentibacter hydroxybenzoicus DSM 7310]|uniref:Isochorismatase family protein n=1 Tax=Sedimentibacter hydroxybenzoicus DSM 7310 TaxID=1123245 RepID=A0A974BLC0_SEDHY|nr:hypothetical protein [Sedimentibacter hydroxybenzoicus]NYB75334.1 hypothetical protein [Sedimentibacter hydroxybenzoicus DSM 7310]
MRPALVIIDMQHYFFRSEERRVKLPELILSINALIDIAYESIPFEVKLNESNYTEDEAIAEINATLAMENMNLTKEDILLLKEYRINKSSVENVRKKIVSEYTKE